MARDWRPRGRLTFFVMLPNSPRRLRITSPLPSPPRAPPPRACAYGDWLSASRRSDPPLPLLDAISCRIRPAAFRQQMVGAGGRCEAD